MNFSHQIIFQILYIIIYINSHIFTFHKLLFTTYTFKTKENSFVPCLSENLLNFCSSENFILRAKISCWSKNSIIKV